MRSILHARSSGNHPKIFASAMRHERSDLSPQRLIRPHRLVQFASKRVLVVISYGKMISNVGLRYGVGRYPGLHLAARLRPRGLPLSECENATCTVGMEALACFMNASSSFCAARSSSSSLGWSGERDAGGAGARADAMSSSSLTSNQTTACSNS